MLTNHSWMSHCVDHVALHLCLRVVLAHSLAARVVYRRRLERQHLGLGTLENLGVYILALVHEPRSVLEQDVAEAVAERYVPLSCAFCTPPCSLAVWVDSAMATFC